jgi:capsular polysaccharide biosynthesis protein
VVLDLGLDSARKPAVCELSSTAVTAGDVYRALWRHKFFIVALTAACVGATWYATSLQTSVYEASTLVRIQSSSLQDSQELARAYSEIIDSGALDSRVRRLVAGRIPRQDASRVRLNARPVEGIELLWISARNDDRERAAIVANAASLSLRGFVRDTSRFLDRVVIVKAATPPTSAVEPRTGLNVAIALALGLIFNSALALFFEMFRDRLPEPEELGQAVGYPVLATIPSLRLRRVTAVEEFDDLDVVAADQDDGVQPAPGQGEIERPRTG